MHLNRPLIGVLATVWLMSAQAMSACTDDTPSLEEFRKLHGTEVRGPISVATLERENTSVIQATGQKLPFGFANAQWNALKAMMKPEDEIYFISRSQNKFYLDGHALVSNGCIVYFLRGAIS